jgi:hypothetical protein
MIKILKNFKVYLTFMIFLFFISCSEYKVDEVLESNNKNDDAKDRTNIHIGKSIITPLDNIQINNDFTITRPTLVNLTITAPQNLFFIRFCHFQENVKPDCILKASMNKGYLNETLNIISINKSYKVEIFDLNNTDNFHSYTWNYHINGTNIDLTID